MTTVVNNPAPAKESGGLMSMVVGGIVLFVLAYLFIVFALPAIRNTQVGVPQINIPSTIDVNVNQPK